MCKFFRVWGRKAGVVTLVMACMFMAGCSDTSSTTPIPTAPKASTSTVSQHQQVAGLWRWEGNSEDISFYVLHSDGRVEAYTGGKKSNEEGQWRVVNEILTITSNLEDVKLCYRFDNASRFTQVYHIYHGKKELMTNDPSWVKVDSME